MVPLLVIVASLGLFSDLISFSGSLAGNFHLISHLLSPLRLHSAISHSLISTCLHLSPFLPFLFVCAVYTLLRLLLFFSADLCNLLNPFPYSLCDFFFPPSLYLNYTNPVYICQLHDYPIFMNIIEHIPVVRR